MKRWKILTISGTDIYLQPAILLYILYVIFIGHGEFMLLSTISIILHELAHAITSTLMGAPPQSLELTPLGAVMRLDDERQLQPIKRAVMLLSGPLLSFALCMIAYRLTRLHMMPQDIGRSLFLANLSILLINLIPALPLDGGRILTLILEAFLPVRISHLIMKCIGNILGVVFILLNIYLSWRRGGWNLSLAFAGCFLLYSAAISTTKQAMAELRFFLDRRILLETKGQLETKVVTALHTQSIRQLLRMLPPNKMALFCCVEEGSMKSLGWMTEAEMIQHYLDEPERSFEKALRIQNNR